MHSICIEVRSRGVTLPPSANFVALVENKTAVERSSTAVYMSFDCFKCCRMTMSRTLAIMPDVVWVSCGEHVSNDAALLVAILTVTDVQNA